VFVVKDFWDASNGEHNPLTEPVVDALREVCRIAFGCAEPGTWDEWNGAGTDSWSFQPFTVQAGPGVLQLVDNYRNLRCPECEERCPVFCNCDWRSARFALRIRPRGW
jgi:hypothetical protein